MEFSVTDTIISECMIKYSESLDEWAEYFDIHS